MNIVEIKFDNETFDNRLAENRRHRLPDYGDLEIIAKSEGMQSGKSIAMITFTVNVKGKRRRVQTVLSMAQLAQVGELLRARVDFEAEHYLGITKQKFSVTGNDGNVLYTRAGRPRVETKEIDF